MRRLIAARPDTPRAIPSANSASLLAGHKEFPTACPAGAPTGCVTDHDLVAKAKEGDANAFGELVSRHSAAVFLAALAALGSSPDAEDVAQETFVQAYKKLTSFREDSSFKTWIVAIAWRRSLSRRRSVLWRVRFFEDAGDGLKDEPAAASASVERLLIAQQRDAALKRLIRALPARLRDPLLLAATGHYTYDDLAVMLRVPQGTVKWRVSEARRIVKAKLSALGYC